MGGKRGKCKWGGKFFFVIRNRRGKFFFLLSGPLKRRFCGSFLNNGRCVCEFFDKYGRYLFTKKPCVCLNFKFFYYKWIKPFKNHQESGLVL